MKRPLRRTSISRSITTRCSLLPQKISALNHVKNASPIPTLLRHKILPRTTIPRKTIPPAAAMIALARILAAVPTAAETVAGIGAGGAGGGGGGGGDVADALRVARVDATCPRPNLPAHQAGRPAGQIVRVDL